MKRRSIPCFFLIVIGFVPGLLHAQSAVMTSGGNATGSNGSVSYSVGQVAYLVKGSNQILEGIQQPYEITVVLATEETADNQKDILLYPNPFKDFLYLDFTSNDYRNSEYQLFDSQGKFIKSGKITESKSEFNFSDLPSAMYIIRINQKGENIKTFKIIKK